MTVPVAVELRALLDKLPRIGPIILVSSDGRPWTSDGFRTSFRRACERAKIVGLTFHDLRGTAVTRLALAGCSALEIAAIVGLSERDVSVMLDRHYLGERRALAEAAIIKLETRTRSVNGAVNGSSGSVVDKA